MTVLTDRSESGRPAGAVPAGPQSGPAPCPVWTSISGSGGRPDHDPYPALGPRLLRLTAMERQDPERRALRNELAVGFRPVVRRVVRRYASNGEPCDDLEQVGMIGLLNALDRFVPPSGVDPATAFISYLVPTVLGEVRRYFRDRTWSVQVPRRVKEIQGPLRAAAALLSNRSGRPPRPAELAAHLGVHPDLVDEALRAGALRVSLSIDVALDPGGAVLGDSLGGPDAALTQAEHRSVLRSVLHRLPERERRVLGLRFLGDMTQTQIGAELGLSQMHVCRLLGRSLAVLRAELDPAAPIPGGRRRKSVPRNQTTPVVGTGR